MKITFTVFISDYSPSSNYSVLGNRVFWFRWIRFWLGFIQIVWDNDATFQVAGTVIWIPCISSLGSIWVVCKLVRECVQGFVFLLCPHCPYFLAHFVQLVPIGQLGENFWGVSYAVINLHVKIQNFIVNIYQNFIGCNWTEVTCTHVMCDDVSMNVCSVYFNIINIFFLPTCFVWGISNQYYMVITWIFNNLYLYECI